MATQNTWFNDYYNELNWDEYERRCEYEFKFTRPTSRINTEGHGRSFDPERLDK